MYEMDGNFRLQNGLTLLSRIWTSRSKSKKAHKMILTWCSRRFSKSVVIFRKTHFLGLRQKSVFQEISTFSVFFMDHIIHICIDTRLKMRLSNVFPNKTLFIIFLPKSVHFIIYTSQYCWTEVREYANNFLWNAFWYYRDKTEKDN